MSTNGRSRPPQDQGKSLDTLDELEMHAKERIKEDGRAAISGRLQLEYRDQEKGFHYYWASDSEYAALTIQDSLSVGYEFERIKYGKHAGDKVIKNSRGCKLYLMRIPVELHLENMRMQRVKVDEVERTLLEVGEREYAGDSKTLGKGKPISTGYTESPLLGND